MASGSLSSPDMIATNFADLKLKLRELADQAVSVLDQARESALALANLPAPTPAGRPPPAATPALDPVMQNLAEAKVEYDSVVEDTRLADIRLKEVRDKLTFLEREVEAKRRELAESETGVRLLLSQKEQLLTEIARSQERAAEMTALTARAGEIERKLNELAERELKVANMAKAGEDSMRLLDKLWPTWLKSGSLAEWKAKIESSAFDPGAPASYGLLFAALHGYNAALKESDPKTLYDNLRDVGRRLYQWLDELRMDALSAASVAESWAGAINAETAGRCFVQVAVPGNPASNLWMTFPPRGNSPDVAIARSWCVLDAQRRPIHRAEVTV